jgi:hypothetical protein
MGNNALESTAASVAAQSRESVKGFFVVISLRMKGGASIEIAAVYQYQ